jgi:asparagine synthase (glutamine-hydrolysing)
VCGIGGVLRPTGKPVSSGTLVRMGERMASRGPDGQAIWNGDGVGLVHRRLSIIDLSPAAACPIPNEDGSMVIVFNGEIYNFRELRSELSERGHTFRSQGDTEAILHGYEEWGLGVLDKLDGMFAFAIWDGHRDRLVLARDRLGEKPLYFGHFADATYFASNPAAIAEVLERTPDVDREALDCYLSHAFIPAQHTIFEGIHTVAAATVCTVTRDGQMDRRRYWDLPTTRYRRMGVLEAEEAVEEAVVRSVRSRLVADVPVGGLLSGGVDSSLVMAIAAGYLPNVRSYSVGFADAEYDERRYAEAVASRIGSRHTLIEVGESDALAILPKLVWEYGQPFGDSSAIPTHLVQACAKRDVTVVLTGDGGDEAFGGYWRALSARYAELYQFVAPHSLRAMFVPKALRLARAVGAGGFASRWSRLDAIASLPPERQYGNALTWYERRESIYGPALRGIVGVHAPERCFTALGENVPEGLVARAMRADYRTQLSDAYLVKVDVAGMAAGVEARPPLLARQLVELAWRLPDTLKVRLKRTKWLLKRIAARYVPREVVYRPKMGFAMPTPKWFRGRLGDVTEQLARTSRAAEAGWIDVGAVRNALAEHRERRMDHSTRLWLFLWLELWIRICLERSMRPTESLS